MPWSQIKLAPPLHPPQSLFTPHSLSFYFFPLQKIPNMIKSYKLGCHTNHKTKLDNLFIYLLVKLFNTKELSLKKKLKIRHKLNKTKVIWFLRYVLAI